MRWWTFLVSYWSSLLAPGHHIMCALIMSLNNRLTYRQHLQYCISFHLLSAPCLFVDGCVILSCRIVTGSIMFIKPGPRCFPPNQKRLATMIFGYTRFPYGVTSSCCTARGPPPHVTIKALYLNFTSAQPQRHKQQLWNFTFWPPTLLFEYKSRLIYL